MNYPMYGYNPYMFQGYQQQNTQQNANGLIWVQGEAGAKAYNVRPGESAFLMDTENPRGYLKSCDFAGIPSMKYFSVTELEQSKPEEAEKINYATQEDLTKIREEIGKIRKSIKSLKDTMEGEENE